MLDKGIFVGLVFGVAVSPGFNVWANVTDDCRSNIFNGRDRCFISLWRISVFWLVAKVATRSCGRQAGLDLLVDTIMR